MNNNIQSFSNLHHVYKNGDEVHVMGYAGDLLIGEYVHLYFNYVKLDNFKDYGDVKIVTAKFSAIGNMVTILAAEKFCSIVEGLTFNECLQFCDPDIGLQYMMQEHENKIHSINFVIQAFYKAIEVIATL